jgi:hypothetical protein
MPTTKQYGYLHKGLYPQICRMIGIKPTRQACDVIKALLKHREGIDSMTKLTTTQTAKFIEESVMFMAAEFGMVLDLPGENGSADKDMKQYLEDTV